MEETKIIFDCDPGTDDAIALFTLLCAKEAPKVEAITVENGNRALPLTLENACRAVAFAGREDLPVYGGCALPMTATLTPERKPGIPRYHMEDMHGDVLPLPETGKKPEEENAVAYLLRTLLTPGASYTVITVGPLTNLAMAYRINPGITAGIKELLIMGGALMAANISSQAEFNFWVDPEAADIVMGMPVEKRIFPLDATWRTCVHASVVKAWEESDAPLLKAAGKMAALRLSAYKEKDVTPENREARLQQGTVSSAFLFTNGPEEVTIHDALPVAYLLHPEVVTEWMDAHLSVDYSGGPSDGRLLADLHQVKDLKPNGKICVNGNAELFQQILTEAMSQVK